VCFFPRIKLVTFSDWYDSHTSTVHSLNTSFQSSEEIYRKINTDIFKSGTSNTTSLLVLHLPFLPASSIPSLSFSFFFSSRFSFSLSWSSSETRFCTSLQTPIFCSPPSSSHSPSLPFSFLLLLLHLHLLLLLFFKFLCCLIPPPAPPPSPSPSPHPFLFSFIL
jgi:hypothetical protein